ncbi:unnamed protein product, partial [marine sediment metagenome]
GRFLRVWDYIKEGLKSPINAMIGLINSFLSKIESGINSMIGGLGKIIPGISKLKISLPNRHNNTIFYKIENCGDDLFN